MEAGERLTMPIAVLSPEELLEATLQLDHAQTSEFLRELHARRSVAPHLSKREDELFAIINASDDPQKRAELEAIRDLAHTRLLDEQEEHRLLELVNWSELDWANRLEAIVELASLRRRTPLAMMAELGLKRSIDEVRVR